LVKLVGEALEREPQINRLPLQHGDVRCTYADISKARQMLGYSPQVAIEEGIPLFVKWFLGQRE
jgi:UDP-glucuronate 4-epimerase